MKFDISKPPTNDTSGPQYEPLPSGEYLVKSVRAQIAPSKFMDEKTKEHRDELTIVWDLVNKVPHPESPEKEYSDRLYQHMSPYAGLTNAGIPSKFLALLQQLANEGLVDPQDVEIAGPEDADNQGSLVDITRRVLVQKYQKTQGVNAGQWGNKIIDILPLNGPARSAEAATKPVPSRPIPPREPMDGEFTEPELRKMSTDELTQVANQLGETAGGRWKRDYSGLKFEGLVRRIMDIQTELQAEELF